MSATATTSNTAIIRNVSISLAVGAFFMYLAFRGVDVEKLRAAFQQFDPRWLIPAVMVSFLLQVFRAWRWQLELRPLERIPLGRLWVVVSVAYMIINLLPARMGEIVRPWLLSRRSSVKFSNVVGNLVVEKTTDSMVIVFYILLGLLTASNLPEWVQRGALVPTAMALVLVTLVLLIWWKGEPFVDRWVIHRLPAQVGPRVKGVVRALLDGMSILPNKQLLGGVFLVSLALWFLPILSSYIMIQAFGFEVPFSAALIVFIFIGFGTALPNAPGMIGTFQYACQLALGLYGIDAGAALAYGLVLNAIQLSTLIVQGLIALPFAQITMADLRRVHQDTEGSAQP